MFEKAARGLLSKLHCCVLVLSVFDNYIKAPFVSMGFNVLAM